MQWRRGQNIAARATIAVWGLAAVFTPGLASAQVLFGSLVGNVTDASGAAVPGATVRITQTDANESRQVQTNDLGVYSFPAVPAGEYAVVVSKPGFETATQRGVTV